MFLLASFKGKNSGIDINLGMESGPKSSKISLRFRTFNKGNVMEGKKLRKFFASSVGLKLFLEQNGQKN